MKTQDLLLIGGLALGAWYLVGRKSQEQQPAQIISGGGGGAPDLSGILGSLIGGLSSMQTPSMPTFFNLGNDGAQLPQFQMPDFSGLYSGLGDMLRGLNLGGGGAGGGDGTIIDKVTDVITDFTNLNAGNKFGGSWTDPWAGVLDPFKNVNKNIAEAVKSAGTVIESGSMVPRVIGGAFSNAMSGNVAGGHATAIAFPGVALISGAIREMQEIATEKNPFMQYTVKAGPGTRATALVEAAAITAQIKSGMRDSAGNLVGATTPQHQAMANEVGKGKTPEAPSASEPKLTNAQTAALMNASYAAANLAAAKKKKVAYA